MQGISVVMLTCVSVPSLKLESLPCTCNVAVQGDSLRNDVTFITNKYALKEEHLFKTCLFWYLKKHGVNKRARGWGKQY